MIIDFGSFLECVVVYSLSNSQLVHIELLRKWEKKSEGGWEREREREREGGKENYVRDRKFISHGCMIRQ